MISEKQFSKWMKSLASLEITVVGLILLFILTSLGTLYQVDYGLYQAKQKYFFSWVIWIYNVIPFPGTRLVLWVLFFNLVGATYPYFKHYHFKKLGLLLMHFGILSMLVGSFITFHHAEETYLSFAEGQTSNLTSSYHHWEISVWSENKNPRKVHGINLPIKDNQKVTLANSWELSQSTYYANAYAFLKTKKPEPPPLNASGIKEIGPNAASVDPAENIPAGIFTFKWKNETKKVLLYGTEQSPTHFKLDGKDYFAQLRKRRSSLPINIKLIDFKKATHPGTQMAKSYESLVEISTPNLQRQVLISMNKPLRFEDYTFYQSSYYVDQRGTEHSTLSVVKNAGRLFPYIASLITFIGLFLHFCLMLFSSNRKNQKELT